MGIVICEKHGQQFIRFVPPPVRRAVLDGEPLSRQRLHRVRHVFFEGEEETWFWCDAESAQRHSIPLDRVLTEDEYWRLSDRIPLEPVCRRCLAELISDDEEPHQT